MAIESREDLELILDEDDYDTFRNLFEGSYHANVHNFVSGDMLTMISPNDPAFFLHHAFVDKIWAEWQLRHPDSAEDYSGVNHRGRSSNLNNGLNMDRVKDVIGNRKVRHMLNTRDWCYVYSDGIAPEAQQLSLETGPLTETFFSDAVGVESIASSDEATNAAIRIPNIIASIAGIFKRGEENKVGVYVPEQKTRSRGSPYNRVTPSCDDRDDEYNIRKATPVPDNVLTMFGLDITTARKLKAITDNYTDYINSVDGYVSDSALRFQKARKYVSLTPEEGEKRRADRIALMKKAKEALNLPSNLKDIL
ncbi:MAG: hypothetical protein SGCHY_004683 [Lobulomycetales sp.]